MLKPTVKRGLMLDFIPNEISCVASTNENRVFNLNNKKIIDGDIVYIATRELRLQDNWGLIFAYHLAKKYNKNFKVVIFFDKNLCSARQKDFREEGLNFFLKNLAQNNIKSEVIENLPEKISAGIIVVDFNPIEDKSEWAKIQDCAVFEVDSHNIIPAMYVSGKQEFSAATLRRKIYANISEFLTEFPNPFECQKTDAEVKLNHFINEKLDFYVEFKDNPNENATSNLSPYLHFGFISAQRIALEVIKSNASRVNKEAFLEELIVRKELADNFCLYNKGFKTFNCIPNWAKETLNAHRIDIRPYIYTLNEFENGLTHDELWNKVQQNLAKNGKIHGYLRMYWAKKILEWSKTPEDALQTAIYLNDNYALDGNDSNGYVGILWSIGGIHDRPFSNRIVTGKIRYMSIGGCKKKFDIKQYLRG